MEDSSHDGRHARALPRRSAPPAATTSGSCSRPRCAGRSTTSRRSPTLRPSVRLCKGIYVEPPSDRVPGVRGDPQELRRVPRRPPRGGLPGRDRDARRVAARAGARARRRARRDARTSSRCCSASGPTAGASSSPQGTRCASTSPTGGAGTSTRCAGCRRTRRSRATSRGTCSGASSRAGIGMRFFPRQRSGSPQAGCARIRFRPRSRPLQGSAPPQAGICRDRDPLLRIPIPRREQVTARCAPRRPRRRGGPRGSAATRRSPRRGPPPASSARRGRASAARRARRPSRACAGPGAGRR